MIQNLPCSGAIGNGDDDHLSACDPSALEQHRARRVPEKRRDTSVSQTAHHIVILIDHDERHIVISQQLGHDLPHSAMPAHDDMAALSGETRRVGLLELRILLPAREEPTKRQRDSMEMRS